MSPALSLVLNASRFLTCRNYKLTITKVDSAAVYKNEKPCGQAIRESGLPREEVFFTSKIQPKELGYEKTVKQIETTLEVTGLKYIDLSMFHNSFSFSRHTMHIFTTG